MLRVALARSSRSLEQGLQGGVRRQWQPQRLCAPTVRTFVEPIKTTDKTILPGSQSSTVAGVPQAPILADATHNPTPTTDSLTQTPPLIEAVPKLPPTPAEVSSATPAPSASIGNLPPIGIGSASTGPSAPPPKPPRRRGRFRRFLTYLVILSGLSYGLGVYYSLVSDNFHDFFTEYIPFGEDAVAYFEERDFRKRFPAREVTQKQHPQIRGENKITISKHAGLSPRVAIDETTGNDQGSKGRHVNAVEDNKPKPAQAQQEPTSASPKERTQAVESAKKDARKSPQVPADRKDSVVNTPEPSPKPAQPAASLVSNVDVPEDTEPVVQGVVKMVNDIITVLNASPDANKFASTINGAKGDLNKIVGEISLLKDKTQHDAEESIKSAHMEFDNAAKELVKRLEGEMREQETRWREEYEAERERLSDSYQQKLAAELDAARKVAEQERTNQLIEQNIALQRKFQQSVRDKIEEERNGRLSKLDDLSKSVSELEQLTSQWNSVIDANLSTQHLNVALEAVRSAIAHADHPTPFINELIALKETAKANDVVNAAIASINPVSYQRGLPSPAALIDRFRRVASEVRRASLLPEDAGIASHAASAVLSRLMFTKKSERGLPEGSDVEATLARTETLLEEGDLDAAAREMNGLQGWAGVLSRDWVAECRRVLETKQAVDVIATEARLQSLLVD